jgi:hypothetical protein
MTTVHDMSLIGIKFDWCENRRVRITTAGFPDTSQLYTDLLKLKARYGYGYVELEFKFLMDLYPFYPPSVRLVRPRLTTLRLLFPLIICADACPISHASRPHMAQIEEFLNGSHCML